MAHQYSLPLLALCFLFLSAKSINAGKIATYWGRNADEGDLYWACVSRNYEIVNIGFLNVFGGKQTPNLDLSKHCSPSTEDCSWMSKEIKTCQNQGVKVFLSLGGGMGSYTLASADDARGVATYLWDNFLGGDSDSRPLGDAVLDGIDFDIEGGTTQYWDDLAKALSEYNVEGKEKKVYLSAFPQCSYPDKWMGTAIDTGLFDYVWVQFYDNPECQYFFNNATNIIHYWNNYWTKIKAGQLFLGVAASSSAVYHLNYIVPEVLISDILPNINTSSIYGGVMLWNRYWDTTSGYSDDIKAYV